ncbi:MAG: hypothetical protein ABW166_11805 [Sedimenticola sp.]
MWVEIPILQKRYFDQAKRSHEFDSFWHNLRAKAANSIIRGTAYLFFIAGAGLILTTILVDNSAASWVIMIFIAILLEVRSSSKRKNT